MDLVHDVIDWIDLITLFCGTRAVIPPKWVGLTDPLLCNVTFGMLVNTGSGTACWPQPARQPSYVLHAKEEAPLVDFADPLLDMRCSTQSSSLKDESCASLEFSSGNEAVSVFPCGRTSND